MSNNTKLQWFHAELKDECGNDATDARYATDVQEAINAWEKDGWKVISL